ncbi:MAG TPA: DUF2314 domain-containing protein [Verrucomicrobiae bacterium]|nr:DUF2314 domain-containing protein [Verrucomicrobiae bacterium]
MRLLIGVFALCTAVSLPPALCSQDLAPNAPADKPAGISLNHAKKFEEAIAPYVKQARETLPRAKKKYLKGLRKGEIFFVTTRFREGEKFEQVFVRVTSWEGDTIHGLLASDMALLTEHKRGETVICKESDVIDWTISKPDGTEEGNFVGKFLDSYKP